MDNIFSNQFFNRSSPALTIPKELGFTNFVTHSLGIQPWQKSDEEPLALERFGTGKFFLQLFIRGNPFQGEDAFKEPWVKVVAQLQHKKLLAGLVVYGSVYLWKELLSVVQPSIPAGYSPGQMPLAQEKILRLLLKKQTEENLIYKSSEIQFID